jgi:hypothetical protein
LVQFGSIFLCRFLHDGHKAKYSGMGFSRPIRLTDKADDIYSDYLEILVGLRYDTTKITWRLDSAAKFVEYESWESHMERGFAQCRARDSKFGGYTEFLLAHRHVNAQVVTWWR